MPTSRNLASALNGSSLSVPAASQGEERGEKPSFGGDSAYSTVPAWVWALFVVLAALGVFSPNPGLTCFAIILLPVCAQFLWRRGEPPVLLFACGMQWLQASAAIFYYNYYHVTLEEVFGGPQLDLATWLSLLGVLVVALGMRLGLLGKRHSESSKLVSEALSIDVGKCFLAYMLSLPLCVAASFFAFAIPSLSQAILAVAAIKWVLLFVLGYTVLEQRRGFLWLAIAVVLEFGIGILGFFASFKSVFFVLLVLVLSSRWALQIRRLIAIGAIATILLALGIVWTAIKSEYRNFLNQGSGMQEINVSIAEQLSEMENLITGLSWEQAAAGLDNLINRTSYVQFFALTIRNVPENLPYEDGALWMGAVKHVFMPRLFFPKKAVLDDSAITSRYTGTDVAGADQGASIGIGYMAESYVDFGPVKMFVPIFIFGLFCGLIYRGFVLHTSGKLLGAGIASAILIFGAYTIETSNVKMLGGNVSITLVMCFMYRFLGRQFMRSLQN